MKKHFRSIFCLLCAGGCLSAGELRTSAENGDAAAQFRLGSEYFYGTETRKQNQNLAAYWFLKAAAAGLPEAQLNYAICLEQGYGVKRDPAMAKEFYYSAYEQGNLTAGLNLALLLLHDMKQTEEAIRILTELSEKKVPAAMTELAAVMFNEKEITSARRTEAFLLLKNACSLPGIPAKGYRLLADCYYGGVGTTQNHSLAAEYLEKAVAMNDPAAMVKLAFFYEHGTAMPEDRQKALHLYRKAAEAGLAFGEYKYAEYICEGMEEGKGLNAAIELYERSAEKNCPQALHRLALFAMTGIGMEEPDKPKAAALFRKAAETGHAPAQYNLAVMFAAGDGIPQDDRQAFFWFGQAAIRGHASAMRRLGECYYSGTGCLKSNEKAAEWIRSAAEAGDFAAQQMVQQGTRSAW